MSKLSCREVLTVFSKLDLENFVDEASVLLTFLKEKCIGRKALVTKTRFRERQVRAIVESLVNRGFLVKDHETCIQDLIYSFLKEVKTTHWIADGGYVVNTLCCFDPQLLDLVSKSVVQLRDTIVIDFKDPWVFEVLGVYYGNKLVLPGVPDEASTRFTDLLRNHLVDGSIVIVWRRFREYVYEASVFHGLTKICLNVCRDQ